MEKFAGYGFNKSHSAAYALIACQTAWLKTHYPAAFMAAVLTADMDNTDKLVLLKDDCSQLGIKLEVPDINVSRFEFTVAGERSIFYGLGAIKGVGQASSTMSSQNGRPTVPMTVSWISAEEWINSGSTGAVLEALVRSGALDCLGENRATLMGAIPNSLRLAEHAAHASAAGQGALFAEQDAAGGFEQLLAHQRLNGPSANGSGVKERASGSISPAIRSMTTRSIAPYFTHGSIRKLVGALPENRNGNGYSSSRKEVTVAGLVMDIRRRGGRVSIVLDDNTDRLEVTLFDEVFNQFRHLIVKDAVLVVVGQLRFDDFLNAWRGDCPAGSDPWMRR